MAEKYKKPTNRVKANTRPVEEEIGVDLTPMSDDYEVAMDDFAFNSGNQQTNKRKVKNQNQSQNPNHNYYNEE